MNQWTSLEQQDTVLEEKTFHLEAALDRYGDSILQLCYLYLKTQFLAHQKEKT